MGLFTAIVAVLLELAPWVLLGAAVAGVLHVALPRDFVPRHLGGGRGSVAKAVALGVPLPLCSCGVIPTGLGLRTDGATAGASVGFMISTPQTGVDSVLVSAAFLGWPFALFKVAAAVVTGLLGGWLTDRVSPAAAVGTAPKPTTTEANTEANTQRRGAAEAWAHGVDVLRNIWGWLAVGVLVSALLSTVVPPSAFNALTSHGAWATMLVVLAISVPLYVCATASVPIAAALVAGGFPPGAALVFLMAGPATNIATIGAVWRTLGRRALGIYLGTIIGGSLAAGWGFDFVVASGAGAGDHAGHAGAHHGAWAYAAVAALLAAFAWFAGEHVRGWLRPKPGGAAAERPVVELAVDGMTCNGCAGKLTRALLATHGVTAAEVDHEAGRAKVYGTATVQVLRATVRATGFRTPTT